MKISASVTDEWVNFSCVECSLSMIAKLVEDPAIITLRLKCEGCGSERDIKVNGSQGGGAPS